MDMEEQDYIYTGSICCLMLEARGMTQAQIGAHLDMGQASVSRLTLKPRWFTIWEVKRAASVLNLTTEQVYDHVRRYVVDARKMQAASELSPSMPGLLRALIISEPPQRARGDSKVPERM